MNSIQDFQQRVQETVLTGNSLYLTARLEKTDPLTYDFYLKKPILQLGFSYHYRTGIRLTTLQEGKQLNFVKKTLVPPFIFISVAITLFFIIFDLVLLQQSINMTRLSLGIMIVLTTALYHYVTEARIRTALEEEVLFL